MRARGSTYKRKLANGRTVWDAVIAVPLAGGRTRQLWKRGHPTKADATEWLDEVRKQVLRDGGHYVEPTNKSTAEYLAEWLDAGAPLAKPRKTGPLRPSTLASYRFLIENHVVHYKVGGSGVELGAIPLRKLSAEALEGLYRKLEADGLSPRTVQYVHTVVRMALAAAAKRRHVDRNVADDAERPSGEAPEMRVWSAEELRAFLDCVREDRLYPAFLLAATTGLRRGELLGLRWREDIDLDNARLSVRQTLVSLRYKIEVSRPKTKAGERTVALDPATVSALKSWRARQDEERLRWGPAYRTTGLVFTRENGEPVHPDRFGDMFEAAVKRSGLPRIRFHDLRHTHATLLLAAGVHPKTVSARLGHASISITLDTYTHAIPSLDEAAAGKGAALIFGA